ncbi:aldehyde dehydrogenase family protein [Serratia quinivorans]|uniref:aldehyde dehydrogenase family protein n=1 Tax=Serratia quinivorans TaxID=137545 RepID=UPI0021770EE1|nr:aldehyde dehydrogenase family protein [Serratia quinivorans]CAI0839766.1 Putative aldehyde dehydrogenase AldA [Serratia quinivorans]CAI1608102.1 Putative aldehyde dehydrogenase AldA [Serratia quinivorans]
MKASTLDFINAKPLRFLLNGQWVSGNNTTVVTNPATQQQITTICTASQEHVEQAISAAEQAMVGWQAMSVSERSACLIRLGNLIDEHAQTMAELECIDVGKPVSAALAFDVPYAAECFRYFARQAQECTYKVDLGLTVTDGRVVKKPYGVCGFIFPWNFPLTLCAWGVAPALAAGNTVVIKPASETPLSTLYLAKLAEEAGIPAGVINVLPGSGSEVGEALIQNSRLKHMSFTGSTEVGRHVAEACGRNLVPVKLELGGKGAAVVFDDANIEAAAEGLVGAITLNAGQVCCTATRWYIQRGSFSRFAELAIEKMNAVVLGNGLNSDTQMGPICTAKQLASVLHCIALAQAKGAEVLCGGKRAMEGELKEGYFLQPTLLTGSEDNSMAQEEIFGPVAYLLVFDDEQEVIGRVNGNIYGLANSVWSQDRNRAERVAAALVSGNSWINIHNLFEYGLPYSACNQSGCGGGVNSIETFEGYLRKQAIAGLRRGG